MVETWFQYRSLPLKDILSPSILPSATSYAHSTIRTTTYAFEKLQAIGHQPFQKPSRREQISEGRQTGVPDHWNHNTCIGMDHTTESSMKTVRQRLAA